MADPDSGSRSSDQEGEEPPPGSGSDPRATDADSPTPAPDEGDDGERPTLEEVQRRYDFEEFGPAEMDEMSYEEWAVAFDSDTWITGTELLDRVEQDLRARIDRRDVFAVLERESREVEGGTAERLVAYSDEGYAAVYEDGGVEGEGTVVRDVKPSVALCSMEEYDPPESAGDGTLPDPDEISEGGSDLGNKVLLAVGGVQALAGVGLLAAWLAVPLSLIAAVFGLGFLAFGVFLVVVVANARLAARFRSEEYRDRLRSVGVPATDDQRTDAPDGTDAATRDRPRDGE